MISLYDGFKKMLKSMIPVLKNAGYSKEEIFECFDGARDLLKKSNLPKKTQDTLAQAMEDLKKEVSDESKG